MYNPSVRFPRRTVGEVIGAEFAYKDGIEERRFIGSSSGRIELRLMGAVERLEMLADQRECIVPRDRNVFVDCRIVAHGLGQAPLHLQPVIAVLHQFRDGMLGEEPPRDTRLGHLMRQRLGTVLTEFESLTMIGIGKGAAWALEAAGLVHREQTARPLNQHALLHEHLGCRVRGTPSTRRMMDL
ncbi:hypothetical protein S1001342_03127 (plasmid) [Acetobacter pasteurianus subsp. pasteurianus]|uniref:Uncharacterized protein n=1 Tax=Acetobacter pasteurianus subsp. pasteurianus TaxID=481145 RepID=A0A1Y0YAI1_ACEPA|nr:hypothetical protein S1001342_03127 [Acetobacter pasteurianus subsp. pasteurianus]